MEEMINRIICGDCLEVMKKMPDKSINLSLTDFPYNIGKDYGIDKDKRKEYDEWALSIYNQLKRISIATIFTPGIANMFLYPKPDWVMCWYKPAAISRSKYGFNCWEPIYVYNAKASNQKPDVIVKPITKQLDTGNHPTPKPIKLFRELVLRFSDKNDIVFDPFLGSGTTAVACKALGRRYIGIEINPDYCKIVERRIANTIEEMFV